MKPWRTVFHWVMLFSILLGLLGLAPSESFQKAAKLQPVLQQVAAQHPDRMLSVIIQKFHQTNEAEQLVKNLGGQVTKDLHIINAFAASLTAKDVLKLAQSGTVRWVSLNAPIESTGKQTPTNQPASYFLDTLRAKQVWQIRTKGQNLQGQGITVAVIDSGVSKDLDFSLDPGHISSSRISAQTSFNPNSNTVNDIYGHGTHVAGIIGGNGYAAVGVYSGIAPMVNLVSLKISDESGMAYEADTVEAMQWVLDNKGRYNIRVVNLSINATLEQSYHTSPIDAAAEILWFNGVVVVASAGNKGPAGTYNTVNAAPANDPFIITVGASDEKGTGDRTDDIIAPYSAFGTTMDGFAKPEIIAPGTSIISVLSRNSAWETGHPERTVMNNEYFRISGTSMAAPMVAGTVALMLQMNPSLNPDQVKYRLLQTATPMATDTTALYLDTYAAVTGMTTEAANTGIQVSQLLSTGSTPIAWNSVNWNSVNWNSVNWNSVNWNSVNWNSVNWNSVIWQN